MNVSPESFFWSINTPAILDVRDSVIAANGPLDSEEVDVLTIVALLELYPDEVERSANFLPDGTARDAGAWSLKGMDESFFDDPSSPRREQQKRVKSKVAASTLDNATAKDIESQLRLPAPPSQDAAAASTADADSYRTALALLGGGDPADGLAEVVEMGRELLNALPCTCGVCPSGLFSDPARAAVTGHSKSCTDQLYAAARSQTEELRLQRQSLFAKATEWRRSRGAGIRSAAGAVCSYYAERAHAISKRMRAADAVASTALLLAHNPSLQGLKSVRSLASPAIEPPHRAAAGAVFARGKVPEVSRGNCLQQCSSDFPALPAGSPLPKRSRVGSTPSTSVPWHIVVGHDSVDTATGSSAAVRAVAASAPSSSRVTPGIPVPMIPPHSSTCPTRAAARDAHTPLSDPWTIDLHGQHQDEAASLVRDALARCQSAGIRGLVLVTGASDVHTSRAVRSEGGRGSMKRRVGAVLLQLRDEGGAVEAFSPALSGGGWAVTVRRRR